MSTMTRHYTPHRPGREHLPVPRRRRAGRLRCLEVTLEYDRSETTLDLGLIGPDQFRGWSGSERTNVVVTERWATPGYLPGVGRRAVAGRPRPVPRRSRRSRRRRAHLDARPATRRAAAAAVAAPCRNARRRRHLPAAPGHEWLAGDFHSHTVHSDGSLEMVELAALGCRAGSRRARRHRSQHGQPSRPSRRRR